jgi:ABC-type Fe3+/spermidine/putrescine transport system ATPase subunit
VQGRPAAAGRPSVEGLVESSLYLGTATQVAVRLAGDVQMTVLVPNADEEARRSIPAPGSSVRLSWAPEHIHVVRESAAAAGPPETDNRTLEEALP